MELGSVDLILCHGKSRLDERVHLLVISMDVKNATNGMNDPRIKRMLFADLLA